MEKKTVSVVMCTYNGERFLREQMDSILAQTYPIHEIIISDDCSTDGTIDILREYAAKHTFIKIHQNARNIGFNSNFYHAFNRATGEYIAISDQDDIWFPQKIEEQVKQISTENHNLCFSESITTDTYQETQVENYKTRPFTAESLFFQSTIPGHNMLVRKVFLESIGSCHNMTFFYDWWISINAALEDSIVRCTSPLVWHRVHTHSVTSTTGRIISKARKHSPIAPYIYGLGHFLKIRKNKSWIFFYKNIYQKTSIIHHPILHQITQKLLSHNPIALIHACFLFMKYREEMYPPLSRNSKGVIFAIRSFFTPFLFFYYDRNFQERESLIQ